MFDINEFQQSAITEAGETKVKPIPVGEYNAIIEDVKLETGEKEGRRWVSADIHYVLQAPDVAKALGREKLALRQRLFLDLDANQKLDMGQGRNINLNRLREAVGQNKAGQKWTFDNLKGQLCKVKTKLRQHNTQQDVFFADVESVGKA